MEHLNYLYEQFRKFALCSLGEIGLYKTAFCAYPVSKTCTIDRMLDILASWPCPFISSPSSHNPDTNGHFFILNRLSVAFGGPAQTPTRVRPPGESRPKTESPHNFRPPSRPARVRPGCFNPVFCSRTVVLGPVLAQKCRSTASETLVGCP